MRILVIGETLKTRHKEQILDVARKYGAKVCFAGTESEVTEEFAEPDVIYGFGMQIAKTQKSLKWLWVPSAGVDYLMKPGVFAIVEGKGNVDHSACCRKPHAGVHAGQECGDVLRGSGELCGGKTVEIRSGPHERVLKGTGLITAHGEESKPV